MSRRLVTYLSCLILAYLTGISCSKMSEDQLTVPSENKSCDTVNMTFSKDVQPILDTNCYGCHHEGNAYAGVALDNYDGVKQTVVNQQLIGVINQSAGYNPMPPTGSKLTQCNIDKITDWVNHGAINN